mgnify:CR=1 FL=1
MYILILTIMIGNSPAITNISGFKNLKECESAGKQYVNENSAVFDKDFKLVKAGVYAKYTCIYQSK